jgi:transposase
MGCQLIRSGQMRRYALRDDQWDRIKDVLPGREGHVGVTAKDNRLFVEAVPYRYRAGMLWWDLPERFGDPIKIHTRFSRWAKSGVWNRSGVWKKNLRNAGGRCGQRIRDDRQHHRTRAPTQRRRSKKDDEDKAIGRSKGGLSTKIHAMVDAPLAFFLAAGPAHDLEGADALLPQMQADTLLADKAFDADERVIEPLLAAGKTAQKQSKGPTPLRQGNVQGALPDGKLLL